jgi:phosphonate transport system substrate-binding protein
VRITLVLLVAFALVGCGPESEGSGAVLKFTAIPDQNTTMLREKFDPVADYLSKKLGIPVEYVPARDYQASVEMFGNGDVHMAWFGGLTGVQAREDVPGAHAIVQGAEDPEFYSYFVAHRDTGLERSDAFPEAISGLSFTFGSPSSTSGRLMPEFFIMERTGKPAEEFFEQTPAFSKSHDQTAELVQNGTYQAGVLNYQVYERRVREGSTDPEVCRVVWKTPTYADYNITVHPDVDELFGAGTIGKLQKALIEMDDPALLAAFGRKKLIAASDEEFAGIREVALKLDMLRR